MPKIEEMIVEWLDINLEAKREDHQSDLEPFDHYKQKVTAQGLDGFNEYIQFVQKGYELIINKIESQKK